MSSRIEQIIEEIEEYVDSCKYQPLSTTKIVVNKKKSKSFFVNFVLRSRRDQTLSEDHQQ